MNDFSIYQLKESEEASKLLFASYSYLERNGYEAVPDNYNQVYQSGTMEISHQDDLQLLEQIYHDFNTSHLDLFIGHSLSMSDVVVINRNKTLTAYYCDTIGWKEIPSFAQALQERSAAIAREAEILREISCADSTFWVNGNSYLSIKETDDGYDYQFYRPGHHSMVEGSIEFSALTDLSEDFSDLPLFTLLTKAICADVGMEQANISFQLMNPDHEHDFQIEPTEFGFQVRSSSERFGDQAIVFQAASRDDCMSYIAERQMEGTPWECYIIPDIMTWARPELFEDRSPLKHYDNVEAAIRRFKELRNEPLNDEQTINEQTNRPYARLTFGIQRDYPLSAVDLIHVCAGKNVLVDDFTRMASINTSAAALKILRSLESEIGFDLMYVSQKHEERSLDANIPYRPLSVDQMLGVIDPKDFVPYEPASKDEALYLIDDENYLHLQETEEGFDYTLFDRETKRLQDGGVLEPEDYQPGISNELAAVRLGVFNLQGLELQKVERVPLEILDELNTADAEHTESFADLLRQGISDADTYNHSQREQRAKRGPAL